MMQNKYPLNLLSMAGQGGSAFGIGLLELAKENDRLMVLSSDMSTPAGLDKFKAAYPDRFLNVGIAEQNMIGIAAGLVDEGYTSISVAQACFITMRCFEQVRQYCGYMGSKQILVGIGSGVSLLYMGNTHFALEDLALMQAIPGMTVLAPCDALEAIKALEAAIGLNAPCYIRFFGGTGVAPVYSEDYEFSIGKAVSLRKGDDIQLIATGSMVATAISVADKLTQHGLSASVTNMHTIKPLDVSSIETDKRLIVTIEEHNAIGGLGSAVANCLAELGVHPRLVKIGVQDCFLTVGSYPYLIDQAGLSEDKIIHRIVNEL
jgi:transketolase